MVETLTTLILRHAASIEFVPQSAVEQISKNLQKKPVDNPIDYCIIVLIQSNRIPPCRFTSQPATECRSTCRS